MQLSQAVAHLQYFDHVDNAVRVQMRVYFRIPVINQLGK